MVPVGQHVAGHVVGHQGRGGDHGPGAGVQSGGIFEREAPIPLSALMVIDPKSNAPTRVRRVRQSDGTTVRVAKSGEQLLVPTKGS